MLRPRYAEGRCKAADSPCAGHSHAGRKGDQERASGPRA